MNEILHSLVVMAEHAPAEGVYVQTSVLRQWAQEVKHLTLGRSASRCELCRLHWPLVNGMHPNPYDATAAETPCGRAQAL